MYMRFASARKDMPHQRLQEFVAIDYSKEMVILVLIGREEKEVVVGIGQYSIDEHTHTAEFAFVVRDDYQNQGVGAEIQSYLIYLAKRSGLLGFTAEVLEENKPTIHLLEKQGFEVAKREGGAYEMKLLFNKNQKIP
jgi:RimJ/RimL family protein N-acetyltransferase